MSYELTTYKFFIIHYSLFIILAFRLASLAVGLRLQVRTRKPCDCMVVKGASFGRSLTPCITAASSLAGFLASVLTQHRRKAQGKRPRAQGYQLSAFSYQFLYFIDLLPIAFFIC
jgi:hypothetical protein